MRPADLSQYLDQYLQASTIPDKCPNGVQVEGSRDIRKVATGVSASLNVLKKAVDWGADAIIVHHGLFWEKDSYRITGAKRKKIALLLERDVTLLAYHLPLDVHKEVGNNWRAARDLGWSDIKGFGDYLGQPIGVQGRFPSLSAQKFFAKLQDYYGHNAHIAPGGKGEITSAALVSGGAHRMIVQAVQAGVDCFITGSFDEPIWHIAHEEGIHFCALGHANTEVVGPKAIGEHLSKRFGFTVAFVDDPNPF